MTLHATPPRRFAPLLLPLLLLALACDKQPAAKAPAAKAPEARPAKRESVARPTPVQTQPLPSQPPSVMDQILWRQHSYTATLDDGQRRTFQLKDGSGRLPGPEPGQQWAMFLHEVSYGDLDSDGRQDAAVGLSWHLEVPQPKGPPRRTRSHALILFYNGAQEGRPTLAAQHQQVGHAVQWLDITEDVELSAGILTRPDAKFNAVEELTMQWQGGDLRITARSKSYSD
jgi:hypothetical protein